MMTIQPLNILFVADYFPALENGGTERQMYNLISGLVDAGHRVKLIVFRDTLFTKEQNTLPVKVQTLNLPKIFSVNALRRAQEIRNIVKDDKIDIVHVFFNDAAIFTPFALAGTKVPVITSRRDMGIWYTSLYLFCLFFANKFVSAVVCNSDAVAGLTCRKELLPNRKANVIYNGISDFCEKSDQNPFPFALDRPVIGLVANISPVKNMVDFINAAAVLNTSGYNFNYVIVGGTVDEYYFGTLKQMIQENELKNNFFFIGSSSCPRKIMSHFSMGVLTSKSEGLSNTLMEYFAAKLPVICTDTGGNPELVRHEKTGLLYQSGDSSALADCIIRLYNDSQLSQYLSKTAYSFVRTMTMGKMIQRHEKLYSSLLQ